MKKHEKKVDKANEEKSRNYMSTDIKKSPKKINERKEEDIDDLMKK
jgi:hypothetical protein